MVVDVGWKVGSVMGYKNGGKRNLEGPKNKWREDTGTALLLDTYYSL
jgi:hypothetical protein